MAGKNGTIQCTGEKRSQQQDRETFYKSWPFAKIRSVSL
jgi:hypothetical protein